MKLFLIFLLILSAPLFSQNSSAKQNKNFELSLEEEIARLKVETTRDFRLSFSECSLNQEAKIKKMASQAVQKAITLNKEIKDRLEINDFKSDFNRSKFLLAFKTLNCTIRKLHKSQYGCEVKSLGGTVARTLPLIGDKVQLFPLYWKQSPAIQASALIHEATHKCGTTDANYSYQWGQRPHSQGIISYEQIASTYDYWIMVNLCVPGEDC